VDKDYVSGLGRIVVQIYRLRIIGKREDQSFKAKTTTEGKKVNERAKKALLTHSVKYFSCSWSSLIC
jgi:hypothetical protein